ncbi:DUF3289 domain-containing protein [Paramixta manurensis]|uniref:DUF3289 domain-containing protein n=1 Tax=Paramixta manurensis TaxID=2740817 RepID=A0A6M8U8B4_9GAMM|nr:DUF3289 domain-containing protein [Erwiniaceae bacterium PD-1]
MPALQLPCTIYQTQHRFNDHSADDMKYGDLTERQLRKEFDLDDVSDVVNPWTCEEVSIFSAFNRSRPKKPEIAKLLYLRAFRIWFVLQRWDNLGFKPFFTNMQASITISGEK